MSNETLIRYLGSLLGLAVGDALGTTNEFMAPGSFEPITDMTGGGPFGLKPGEWTDDTTMAMCIAESLVTQERYDAHHQMTVMMRWYQRGYRSVKGFCFDIGQTVRLALRQFELTGDPYAGSTAPATAGNGSLVRMAPIVMAFASHPSRAIALAADHSRTTHAAPVVVDACRYFAGLLVGALRGASREELLARGGYQPVPGMFERDPLHPAVQAVVAGSFLDREPPEIKALSAAASSLEAALWAFHRSSSFAEGALLAANLGDDADSVAAIYGQLAGAYYGRDGIPSTWREMLVGREDIEGLAAALFEVSHKVTARTTLSGRN
ncbi:MAG: ADP-ribosylglycohydrolase family protein [bacterium]|nr:ADP-ribosylglycohydrolase family protein [bacterium]